MVRWRLGTAALALATVAVAVPTVLVARAATGGDPDRSTLVRAELAALGDDLEAGAGHDMQQLFPEGYFFTHALHGLAWTDLAAAGQADPAAARAAATRAVAHLTDAPGTAPFSPALTPRYGVFHAGWSLLLRAQLGGVGPPAPGEREGVATAADELAAAFATALDAGRSPFLEAYPAQSWPVDSVVAVAALVRADRFTGADHGALVARWRARATALVDPSTGLLPHRTEPGTGRAREGTRATSQSIIQRFWPGVDPAGAPAAWLRYRDRFVTAVAGFVGVREYPPGIAGEGDVDSGPLVAGLSASATAVTIGAARANGDGDLAAVLTAEAEVAGLPAGGDRRRYLLGRMPVADAFLAWSRAAPVGPVAPPPGRPRAWWPLYLAAPWVPLAAAWWVVGARRRLDRAAAGHWCSRPWLFVARRTTWPGACAPNGDRATEKTWSTPCSPADMNNCG